jgi:hypothetical protein
MVIMRRTTRHPSALAIGRHAVKLTEKIVD